MKVAFNFTSTFGGELLDERGRIVQDNSGTYLLKRLMGLFEEPILLADAYMPDSWAEERGGYLVHHRNDLRVEDTVLVNMDMLTSPALFREMKQDSWRRNPKLVNFVWWNTSEYADEVSRVLIAMSAGLFPTLANSSRTAQELMDLGRRYCSPKFRSLMSTLVDFCPLGIDLVATPSADRRPAYDGPLRVWYPSTWLFARKQPTRFVEIVRKVESMRSLAVRVRLHQWAIDRGHGVPAQWQHEFGWDVGPARDRSRYGQELLETDAFVATALDESYGLAYLEALYAGAVGVFPNRPWVDTILPSDYPFRYADVNQAAELLAFIARDPAGARAMLPDMKAWIEREHNSAEFDKVFFDFVTEHSR